MRSQLMFTGIMTAGLGTLFYILQIPLAYFWSVPFIIGGGIMFLVGPFLSESSGPVQPPEGFRYCVFCRTPVRMGLERCQQCGGLQPPIAERRTQ